MSFCDKVLRHPRRCSFCAGKSLMTRQSRESNIGAGVTHVCGLNAIYCVVCSSPSQTGETRNAKKVTVAVACGLESHNC